MAKGRWRLALGPVLGALGVALLLGSATLDATGAIGERPEISPRVPGCAGSAAGARAWYELAERSDRRGALTGYELRFGSLAANSEVRTVSVPPESHASGPFGDVVLYGTEDGTRSELRLLDAATGCGARIAESNDVIRRSTVDPAGTHVYFHLVARATRTDLGIWRRAIGAGTVPARVLPPLNLPGDPPGIAPSSVLPDSPGTVFSTEFAWDGGGASLAVQSCGAIRCQTRVLDTKSGKIRRYADFDQGEMLGLTAQSLIAYRACHGLPCPIAAIDRATGAARDVVPAAEGALLAERAGAGVIVFERPVSNGYELASLDIASGSTHTLYRVAKTDLRLLPQASRSLAAASLRHGWVVLAPPQGITPRTDGRALARAEVLRASDGARYSLHGGAR